MGNKLGFYSEPVWHKDVDDDEWGIFYRWYQSGCPDPDNPDVKISLTPEEIKIIEEHASRSNPHIIRKGEKHARKFYFNSRGSFIWRCNLQIYKISEKYNLIPPDERDFSSQSSTPADTQTYNLPKQ